MGITIRNIDNPDTKGTGTVIAKPLISNGDNGNGNGNGNGNELEAMLHHQKHIATSLGAATEIRGSWVWATFPSMPNSDTRDQLKANHWVWCKHHAKWAYRGKRSYSKKHMDWGYIITKYPEED